MEDRIVDVFEGKSIEVHHSWIAGVHVESTFPNAAGKKADPIIFVHGGCHGSWSFHNFLSFFAASGWESHALNWFNHHGSQTLPPQRFLKRGLADLKEEIALVASALGVAPIVIGHSMGGMAAQKFAEENDLRALVLMAPVVSSEAGVDPVDIPVDADQAWPPPPFDVARRMFFDGLEDKQAQHFYTLLCPESPRCVYEASRFAVSVDYTRIACPIIAIGAEHDQLVPPGYVRTLAHLSGADFHLMPGRGHNLLLEPKWRETAGLIGDWLTRKSL